MSPTRPSTRLVRGLALAAVAALALSGCTSTAGATSGAAQPIAKEDLVLVASVINTTNPYMASNIAGAEALSKKLDIPLEIVDSNGSSQTEISKIQAILAKGKKVALFVNTVASSDAPTIVNAVKQAGGFVTIWWNKPDNLDPAQVGDNFVAFQKIPGVESGKCNADALGESLNGTGNVVMLPACRTARRARPAWPGSRRRWPRSTRTSRSSRSAPPTGTPSWATRTRRTSSPSTATRSTGSGARTTRCRRDR